jgi:hypothetical protein
MPHPRISERAVEFAGNRWLVEFSYAVRVEAEDIPEHVAAAVSGLAWLTDVGIQPISAPDDAKGAIKEALRTLAEKFHGVVEDQQIDGLLLPSGPQQIVPGAETDGRISTLNLNYWFTESPLRTNEGRGLLIEYLAEHLPAALPRRYGLNEPPTEKWKDGGKAAFLDFLDRQPPDTSIVIYPTRPCVAFNLSPAAVGWVSKDRFRCGCLQFSFEFAALEDAEWRATLKRAWRDIANIVEAFATNVEVVDGWNLHRGRLWADRETGDSVCSSAWFGVPRRLGLAFGLAEKYVEHWPQLRTHAVSTSGLASIDTEDWRSRRGVSDIVGEAPEAIRERLGRGRTVGSNGTVGHKPFPEGLPREFLFPAPHRSRGAFADWLESLFRGR